MSSGHPRRRIVTPFGVVSVVGLGSGVPDLVVIVEGEGAVLG